MILRSTDADVRYEVSIVNVVLDENAVISWTRREFKSLKGAEAYQAKLQREGHTTMLRVGVMVWANPKDAAKTIDDLQRHGVTWQ